MPGEVAKNIHETRQPPLKGQYDEWLARIVAFAFSIPPTPFIAQVNRATAESAHDQALEEGLAPLQKWAKRLIDRIIAIDLGFPALEFAWEDQREQDPKGAAEIETGYVRAGIKSINEARAGLGLDPVAGGERPMVATGQGYVPIAANEGTAGAGAASAPVAKYSSDQPRVPKGQSEGGQWTRDGGSGEESASPGRAEHGLDMSGVEADQRNDRQERNEDGESGRTRMAESGEIRSDATRAPAPAPTSRALTPGEIELARSLLGDGVDYGQVQIHHEKHNWLQGTNQTVSIGGNIYFPSDNPTYRDDFSQEDVASEEGVASQAHFLHEMTHLVQEREGINVMLAHGADNNYYYEIDGNSPRPLHTYGIEQQATIVEDYYRLKHGLGPAQPGQTRYPLSVYERVLEMKDDGTIGAPFHIRGTTPLGR